MNFEEIKEVKELGKKIGYGQLMSLASALWSISLADNYSQDVAKGAFVPVPIMDVEPSCQAKHQDELDKFVKSVREVDVDETSAWSELIAENRADARQQMEEPCATCGVQLKNHYDGKNRWIPCDKAVLRF